MLPAIPETILGVDEGLLKTCQDYIREIWYNTRELSIFTTTDSTGRFHEKQMAALNTFSPHSP